VSEQLGIIRFETRIRDFGVEPKEVVVGETVKVSGYLEFYNWTKIPARWEGLDGKRLSILINGKKVAEATATHEGYFESYIRMDSIGTYIFKASFEGVYTPIYDWLPTESVEEKVEVITEEEKEEREERKAYYTMLFMLGLVGTVTSLGVATYLLTRRRG